jgi:hypothetical protein
VNSARERSKALLLTRLTVPPMALAELSGVGPLVTSIRETLLIESWSN